MKEYLLDNGFTEITKNQYQLDDNIVVIRGKRVDVFIHVNILYFLILFL